MPLLVIIGGLYLCKELLEELQFLQMGANVCCRVRSDQVFVQEAHCHEMPFPLFINLIYRLYLQIESHTIYLLRIGVFFGSW